MRQPAASAHHLGRASASLTMHWDTTTIGSVTNPPINADPSGAETPLGDGQSHDWDIEWLVPVNVNAANVRCRPLPEAPDEFSGGLPVQGSGTLN